MHKPGLLGRLTARARALTREVAVVYRVARDPRVPWGPRLLAFGIAAYVLSPIDLIPDVIPVLGLLDEIILVPIGLWLVIRLVPPHLLDEHRRAVVAGERLPRSPLGAALVVAIWAFSGAILGLIVWHYLID